MIRIYSDFNNRDEQGRVRLNTVGSLKDLDRHKHEVREGLRVVLYMSDEFEVSGTLVHEGGIWCGIPAWETIRYYNEEDDPRKP